MCMLGVSPVWKHGFGVYHSKGGSTHTGPVALELQAPPSGGREQCTAIKCCYVTAYPLVFGSVHSVHPPSDVYNRNLRPLALHPSSPADPLLKKRTYTNGLSFQSENNSHLPSSFSGIFPLPCLVSVPGAGVTRMLLTGKVTSASTRLTSTTRVRGKIQ